jgi:hypothetical protein
LKQWVILLNTGEIQAQVFSDVHPAMNATRTWDATWTAYEVPRFGDLASEKFVVGSGWAPDLALIKARLLARVDDQREAAQMGYLTQGGAKKLVYMQKAREVIDFRSIGSAVVATLNLETCRVRFPAAMAEADLTGATIAAVIAKFEAGAASSNAAVMRLEAIAQAAKDKIKAATTETAAAAAAAVIWKAK